ncbi:MAG: transglycosylase [Betaproteobacteria bacterium]|nr:transglycosylase [Betaproteobacteria bacterium]
MRTKLILPAEDARSPYLTPRTLAAAFLAAGLFMLLAAWNEHLHQRMKPAPAPALAASAPELDAAPPEVVFAPRPLFAGKKESAAVTYRRLGDYVARRYRISSEVATEIVVKAHLVGRRLGLDPLLLLAIISVESRFNPLAQSERGAKGLMQVIPRFHEAKLISVGGEEMVFELEPNITVGARILKEYLHSTGDLVDALQRYVGASSEEDAAAYSEKIGREQERFQQILHRGSSAGTAL